MLLYENDLITRPPRLQNQQARGDGRGVRLLRYHRASRWQGNMIATGRTLSQWWGDWIAMLTELVPERSRIFDLPKARSAQGRLLLSSWGTSEASNATTPLWFQLKRFNNRESKGKKERKQRGIITGTSYPHNDELKEMTKKSYTALLDEIAC